MSVVKVGRWWVVPAALMAVGCLGDGGAPASGTDVIGIQEPGAGNRNVVGTERPPVRGQVIGWERGGRTVREPGRFRTAGLAGGPSYEEGSGEPPTAGEQLPTGGDCPDPSTVTTFEACLEVCTCEGGTASQCESGCAPLQDL